MTFRGHAYLTYAVWITLCVAFVSALIGGRWSLAFVAVLTFVLSIALALAVARFRIQLPLSFFAGIVLFIFGTIFLGEAFDFYERYWWWDIALHGGSAVGFGLIGFLFVLTLFEGDRLAAPHWALALITFCFAMTIGVSWEVFEFAMDQLFGLNMQKSGLVDTMWDLIVDMIGASIAVLAGFAYLKGRDRRGLARVIAEFVRLNKRFFTRQR